MTNNIDGTTEEVFTRLLSMFMSCSEYWNMFIQQCTFPVQPLDENFGGGFAIALEFSTHFQKCYDMIKELKLRYDNKPSITDNEPIATTYTPNFTLIPAESESSSR